MKTKAFILVAFMAIAGVVIFLPDKTGDMQTSTLPGGIAVRLPEPTANNAVAGLIRDGGVYLYSFSGLGTGKTPADIHARAYMADITERFAAQMADVPGPKGRLASIAANAGKLIYVIGGYTVDEAGNEVSTPEVFAFDPETETYAPRAPMPTPVDDTVALPYQDRYIYLVSGWHNESNVSGVQVYDTREDRWFKATEYPGTPVFGHAGGIAGNRFVIADGVAVLGQDEDGRRQFGAVEEAWLGTIDPENPANITWEALPPHPGNPLYRMAATGVQDKNLVVFAGGSDNPYNYNGIGYNGEPSQPSATVFGYDIVQKEWRVFGQKPFPTMDHRGLVGFGGRFYIIGGLGRDQEVLDTVAWFDLEAAK